MWFWMVLGLTAQGQELGKRECRERLDAFYAEPARTCSPAADEAQMARVAASQGRSARWAPFFETCAAAHVEFELLASGCEPKVLEGYPNEDWRTRWSSLEAIEEAVQSRLAVYGCAQSREPHLQMLTSCVGLSCGEVAQSATDWATECAPEALQSADVGVGYRKSFELVGMLIEEARERESMTARLEASGTAVKEGRADGLLLALSAPWCTDCLLYTSPSPRDLSTSRMPSSA